MKSAQEPGLERHNAGAKLSPPQGDELLLIFASQQIPFVSMAVCGRTRALTSEAVRTLPLGIRVIRKRP